jgi:hypothetical protein
MQESGKDRTLFVAAGEGAQQGGVQLDSGLSAEVAVAAVSKLAAPPYPDKIGNKPNKAGGYVFELDIERMHQSDTWAIADARQRPLLLMLWTVSWTQVPCGTLPDDDAVIAVRIGLPVPEFKASKEVLMRGWWKANNGRLYHPVITEQVIGVMERKAKAAARQKGFRERQGGGKPDRSDEPIAGSDGKVTRYPGVTDGEVLGDCTISHSPTTTTTTTNEDQNQSSLRSDSSTAAPLTADTNAAGAKKKPSAVNLAQVTRDAVETFNASKLTKANGGLVPNITPDVGAEKRRAQVAKSLKVARDICCKDYESDLIVREFWVDYWGECLKDEHKSGRAGGGKDHGNWVPTFEYLTREATMLEIYDRVASRAAEGAQ